MTAAYTLALAVLLAGDPSTEERKPNPFAPSLRQLTDAEEEQLDKIIDRFILYDSGRLPGEEGKKARRDFDKLGPDTIPALIRGLNRAAAIDHSCPAVVIAQKLARMLSTSTDTELLEFVRENAGAGVTRSRHMGIIKDLRTMCMLRKGEVVRRGLASTTSTPAAVPTGPKTPRMMTVSELAEAVGKERDVRQLKEIVAELGRRRGDDALAALASAAAGYDREVQQQARDQLNRHLAGLQPASLKEKLKDDRAEVRAGAARVVGDKGLRYGGELIDLFDDKDAAVQGAAHQALVKLNHGTDLGPGRDPKEADWAEAAKKWRAWWSAQGSR